VDERCEQYSDMALTAEIRTHGGCEGFTPVTVACRNLKEVQTFTGPVCFTEFTLVITNTKQT